MSCRKITRIILNDGCCSKKEIFLQLDFSLDIAYLAHFIALGYIGKQSYSNMGVSYLEGKDFTVIGPFGSTRLRVKCKNSNCLNSLEEFEAAIKEMPDDSKAKIPESQAKTT